MGTAVNGVQRWSWAPSRGVRANLGIRYATTGLGQMKMRKFPHIVKTGRRWPDIPMLTLNDNTN